MPLIRIVLLLLVVGSLALFAVSNLSPVLSVVFLGMNFPTLPLVTWIGCAIAAGALTSFLLQLLSSLPRGYSRNRFTESDEFEEDVPPTRQASWQNRENQTINTPPPPRETPKNQVVSDWEETVNENWDLGENRGDSKSNTFGAGTPDPTSYETPQQPQSRVQSGSVYSWSYRETKDSGVGKADVVYDANYRVITPPSQPTVKPQDEDEDEDWGFEDDEDFNDEGDSKKKR